MYQIDDDSLLRVVRKCFSKLGLMLTALRLRSSEDPNTVSTSGDSREEEVYQLQRSLEALRLSEALHRSIVASAADAILVVDGQAVIENMNPAAERMFGYT